jgi:lipopolysaccharide biosynthesis glycosyltransferase
MGPHLNEVLVSIVFNWDLYFTSQLWPSIQSILETRLKLSKTFYSEIDGQSERTIQILKDLLRSFVLDFEGN